MFWDQSSVVWIAQKMHPSHHCLRSMALGHVSSVATRGPQNNRAGGRCSQGKSPRPNLPPDSKREKIRGNVKKGKLKQKREMKREEKRVCFYFIPSYPVTPWAHLSCTPLSKSDLSTLSSRQRVLAASYTHPSHHVLCLKQWWLCLGFENRASASCDNLTTRARCHKSTH